MSYSSSCTGSPNPFICIFVSNLLFNDPSTVDPIFVYFTIYTLFIVVLSIFLSVIQFIAKCCKWMRYGLGASYLLFCVVVVLRALYLIFLYFCTK